MTRATAPTAAALVERLRGLHLRMVDAVLGGEGLGRVAELAAEAAGGAVVIVVPRLGAAVAAPAEALADGRLAELRRHVADRVADRPVRALDAIACEVPIASGDDFVGAVMLIQASDGEIAPEAEEYLHLAAVASLTEVAVEEARDEVEQNLRGSFLEDLRSGAVTDPEELVRRAARLGCDLERGMMVLCAQLTTERPRHVVATIVEDVPGALAQHMGGAGSASATSGDRVYALLPAAADGTAAETVAAAGRLADRLRRHGMVGLSSFYADPAELGRAVQEAELVLDVLSVSGEGGRDPILEDINRGTYRLLFRVLASHPEEVRSFYEDTVAPLVRYDAQYRTDLVGTLESYLAQNCNMNATAAAIYAHRHTVAYRLERVRDLTKLDPMLSEDRERLGLGLKAYRIIAPRLPR